VDVHQCPRCELIFGSRPELEDHVREAHPSPPEPDDDTDDTDDADGA